MTSFGILGVGGYVAPRHLDAMRAVGGRIAVACDPRDSVGLLDRYDLATEFVLDEAAFARALARRAREPAADTVRYVAVCTPNHLHLGHCRLALEAGADAICEKPLVLEPGALDELARLEERSGRRIHAVLQLREHPALVALRERLLQGGGAHHAVTLTYVTGRGPWYQASWKGDPARSGGIALNIGIHLFDLVLWLFGPVVRSELHRAEATRLAGALELERASVRWFLSVEPDDARRAAPGAPGATCRSLQLDGEGIDFTRGFEGLHASVYTGIVAGRGAGIDAARPSLMLASALAGSRPSRRALEPHPWAGGG